MFTNSLGRLVQRLPQISLRNQLPRALQPSSPIGKCLSGTHAKCSTPPPDPKWAGKMSLGITLACMMACHYYNALTIRNLNAEVLQLQKQILKMKPNVTSLNGHWSL